MISIPAEPADAADLPPALQPFGAVPPLVTDLALSVDDQRLYVSCWGTGEMKQYDVSATRSTRARSGQCESAASSAAEPHPARPDLPLAGGPQMVEVSRDSKRVYFTNSLYGAWDDQFYPDGVGAWMAKLDVGRGRRRSRSMSGSSWKATRSRGRRPHQVRLQGGDASSDSYCYPPD